MDARIIRRAGWLAFAAMWVPFTGIFIGMIGMPNGSYDWAEIPTFARFSVIATGILFGFSMLGLFGAPIYSSLQNRRIIKEGLQAEAIVLDLWDTGTTVNQNPIVGLRLEVRPTTGSTFTTETERLTSRVDLPKVQPGSKVQVKYDPDDETAAVISL